MRTVQSTFALLSTLLLLQPALAPAQFIGSNIRQPDEQQGYFSRFISKYRNIQTPPVNLSNSRRLEDLLRAGKLYLSLQDTIALALENNLDIEISRYGGGIAESNVLRATAGGLLRGQSQTVTAGPQSAANLSTGNAGGASNGSAFVSSSGGTSSGGTLITATGVAIPQFDDFLQAQYSIGHSTNVQSNSFTTGTSSVVIQSSQYNVTYQKAISYGTTFDVNFNNLGVNSNAPNNSINPLTNSSFNVQLNQRLLQGFGSSINTRNIRIAKNNLQVNDLVFKQQVIQTVYAVINLYWDLVAFNDDVKVKQQAVAYAEKLYSDNKKQVEIGTLAPIEVTRAEAEVANTQQNLTQSETQVLQQETIIKNYLSRTGVASPLLAEARIVPTDTLPTPGVEPVTPMQELVEAALAQRPELPQADVNITNSKLSLLGDKSQLLPALDLFVSATNNALAGSANVLPPVDPTLGVNVSPGVQRKPNPALVGGYGTVLSQLLTRKFPDYRVGLTLNVPLKNRSAQADIINDTLSLRQAELNRQKQINQIRVDVQNAQIGIQQSRARYNAAVKTRVLQEQTLEAEQKKYALGASTVFQVIQDQRDLANARGAEVNAEGNYARARNQLDFALGRILENNNVDLQEAKQGVVNRQAAPLPVLGGTK